MGLPSLSRSKTHISSEVACKYLSIVYNDRYVPKETRNVPVGLIKCNFVDGMSKSQVLGHSSGFTTSSQSRSEKFGIQFFSHLNHALWEIIASIPVADRAGLLQIHLCLGRGWSLLWRIRWGADRAASATEAKNIFNGLPYCTTYCVCSVRKCSARKCSVLTRANLVLTFYYIFFWALEQRLIRGVLRFVVPVVRRVWRFLLGRKSEMMALRR